MSPTTTEASRYQLLRGHLAHLKLATAAVVASGLAAGVGAPSATCHRGSGHAQAGPNAAARRPTREPDHVWQRPASARSTGSGPWVIRLTGAAGCGWW